MGRKTITTTHNIYTSHYHSFIILSFVLFVLINPVTLTLTLSLSHFHFHFHSLSHTHTHTPTHSKQFWPINTQYLLILSLTRLFFMLNSSPVNFILNFPKDIYLISFRFLLLFDPVFSTSSFPFFSFVFVDVLPPSYPPTYAVATFRSPFWKTVFAVISRLKSEGKQA